MNINTEVLIIGAGPSGMSAAIAAASSGASVTVLDDNPREGGQIWRAGPQAATVPAAEKLREQFRSHGNIQHVSGTQIVARAGEDALLVEDAASSWTVTYKTLILCTGARELLLPFPGWTLPGVTGAGGLQALIKGGLPVSGERIVIAGSGPLLLASAATAKSKGAEVIRIAEQASLPALSRFAAQLPRWPRKLWQSFTLFDHHYRANSVVLEAIGTDSLEGVRISQAGKIVEMACDRLACGFGLIPNTQLALAMGCELNGKAVSVDPWQSTSRENIFAAGECAGVGGSELALVTGAIAGYAAVGAKEEAKRLWPARARWAGFASAVERTFSVGERVSSLCRDDTLVCRCEDVSYNSLTEHSTWRDAKLKTRCGMGACQGRVCAGALEHLFGWSAGAPRPPFSPARIETLINLSSHQETT